MTGADFRFSSIALGTGNGMNCGGTKVGGGSLVLFSRQEVTGSCGVSE